MLLVSDLGYVLNISRRGLCMGKDIVLNKAKGYHK